jgi:hypothetical protein
VTTAKVEENLLTYSQEFDNAAWVKSQSSITANSTTAPDGTSTADTLTDNSAAGTYHYAYQVASFVYGTTYVLSCYAKNNNGQYIGLSAQNDVNSYAGATFDLVNGTFNTNQAGTGWFASASMTSVGNGWYRCVVAITSGITLSVAIQIYRSNSSSGPTGYGMVAYTGSGQSVYIWGAQLEQRSSATAYTATTTQAITNYIPKLLTAGANQPRFDHNPTTGESLGLLIEEQRTNSVTNSDMQAGWSIPNAGYTYADKVIAPDGSLISSINKNSTYQLIRQGSVFNPAVSATYTVSFWAKAISGSNPTVSFDLGDLTGSGTAITTTWTRYSFTQAVTAGATPHSFLDITLPDNVTIALWGVQVETGASMTSYIATTSTATTRNADTWVIPNTHFTKIYNFAEFSIYLELARNYATAIDSTIWQIGTGTGNIQMYQYRNSGYVYLYGARNNHSTLEASISTTTTVLSTAYAKIAGSFKTNNFNLVINSVVLGTDTTGQIPTEVTEFIGGNLPGYYKKIMIYPILVTNAQLQALTS